MSEELYGFSLEQVRAILAGVRRLNLTPRGSVAGAGTYRPPSYNVAEFKLQASLSDSSTSGVDAKFWYDDGGGGTEGDTVKIYPGIGVGGTVPSGRVVVAYWWSQKWKFLATYPCPN
jgi:hypothetical protein